MSLPPLTPEQEKERLAKWLRYGVVYDPRNEQDYDTFEYGTEPIPNDCTWIMQWNHEKPKEKGA